MRKITTIFILISTILISCNQGKDSKIEREGEPEVYNVEETDVAMNEAMEEAKRTFDNFAEFLKNNDYENYYYSIKQRFSTPDDGSEHIWIGQIMLDGDNYKGIVGNEPVYTNEVNLGDTVVINKNNISDWMIVDDTGKTQGAYTIRVIRDKMTPQEKQEFDKESGLLLE